MAAPESQKPRWRGVLHNWAAWWALGAGSVLVAFAPSARAGAAAAVYALSLVALFAISAIYHRIDWSERARARMRRLDHASIFLLIAGTYTPVAVLGLPGDDGRRLLIAIWAGAAVGIVQSIFWVGAPKAVAAIIAVAVGWTIVPYLGAAGPLLTRHLGLIVAGGIAYTAGAIVYAAKRPNPHPRIFGYHEVFHALTVAGAVLHFVAVAQMVRSIG
ncbi:MAG TPA: hemolysin III family protein [Thermoanaerobaculia bacterium]|nr:hemolysin III family protein [Thermoanaerobaculia bacterium]